MPDRPVRKTHKGWSVTFVGTVWIGAKHYPGDEKKTYIRDSIRKQVIAQIDEEEARRGNA